MPHHVTQRGNHRSTVFFDRSDGLEYLRLLRESMSTHTIEVVAYCLMPNHVHLVLVPATEDGLHRALKVVHGRYAMRINRMRSRIGHLWQDRYFSSPLDSAHFINAVRYVELNPVRAGLSEVAEDYEWSSAAAHCGRRRDALVELRPRSGPFRAIDHWSAWLADGLPDECVDFIRRQVKQNLPCGSAEFIAQLEAQAGRSLQFRPPGRPKKSQGEEGAGVAFLSSYRPPFRKRGR